jgi:4'-phosphopantetheinyl transferase EntD
LSAAETTTLPADIDAALETVESSYTEIAIDEAAPTPRKSRRERRSPRAKSESLEGRVAAENVYVRQDLRRIGFVSVVLVVVLAVAYVLFYAVDLLGLY